MSTCYHRTVRQHGVTVKRHCGLTVWHSTHSSLYLQFIQFLFLYFHLPKQKQVLPVVPTQGKLSEVLLPLWHWSELPFPIVMCERQGCCSYIDNLHIPAMEAKCQRAKWELRATQSVAQNWDQFLKPCDVFTGAPHRMDPSQSAACLLRAAFDPGERKIRKMKNGPKVDETEGTADDPPPPSAGFWVSKINLL